MDILILLVGVAGFVLAIIIHEIAHGLVAERLGDPTARLMGRLSLNPIPHIDIFGSILLPLTLLILRSPFLFGWAKPVPVDPYNLKHPRKDMALISLAGPSANFLMAILFSVFLRILMYFFPSLAVFNLFYSLIGFNVVLGLFNLLPVNPLDGGKILAGILPEIQARIYTNFLDRFGLFTIVLLLFPIFGGTSIATLILSPVIGIFLNLLIPGYSGI